ncbi:hypothetical protein BJ742DRAFT_810283 [Cladochytrium replicatum]|nr:hypothetical protein BJ742DRAFT_810283 [Cladochytrium replicatum]
MLHCVPVGAVTSSCALHYQQDACPTLLYGACSLSANVAHPGRADDLQSATCLQRFVTGIVTVVLDSILVVVSNGLSPGFCEQKQLSIPPCHFWRRSRRYTLAHEGIKTVKVWKFDVELLLPSIQALLAVLICNPVSGLLRDFHTFFVLPFIFFNFQFHLSVASTMRAFLVRLSTLVDMSTF